MVNTSKSPKSSDINSRTWRNGYLDARRSFFYDNERNTRMRLKKMGISELSRLVHILDFGCGDGNLILYLKEQGFQNVFGIEPDRDLLQRDKQIRAHVLTGKAPLLPFIDACFDVIISMAVLHHLPNQTVLQRTIQEFHRVLRPGGLFCYTEPSDTWIRAILTPILLSPLSRLTNFSRKKRLMVLEEFDTLQMWLQLERSFAQQMLALSGFHIKYQERKALKTFGQAIKI